MYATGMELTQECIARAAAAHQNAYSQEFYKFKILRVQILEMHQDNA